jgi:hypothetical protein
MGPCVSKTPAIRALRRRSRGRWVRGAGWRRALLAGLALVLVALAAPAQAQESTGGSEIGRAHV